MNIPAAKMNEQRRTSIIPAAAVGAVAGMGARYVVPTKTELNGLFNKQNVDTFVSSAATSARGNARSALKYAGAGAVIAAGLNALKNALFPKKEENSEYSKMGIFLDAPDYAYAVYCYGNE